MSSAFWRKFMVDAGIPVRAAESYATTFVDNRITENMIPDLNKTVLNDLGITLIGDVISILKQTISLTSKATAEKMDTSLKGKKAKAEKKAETSTKKVSEVKKSVEVKKTEALKSEKIKVTKRPETKPAPSRPAAPPKLAQKSAPSTSILKKTPLTKQLKRLPQKIVPPKKSHSTENIRKKVKLAPKQPSAPSKQPTQRPKEGRSAADRRSSADRKSSGDSRNASDRRTSAEGRSVKTSSVATTRQPLLRTQPTADSESEADSETSGARSPVMRRVYGKQPPPPEQYFRYSSDDDAYHADTHHATSHHAASHHSDSHHSDSHHSTPHHSTPHHATSRHVHAPDSTSIGGVTRGGSQNAVIVRKISDDNVPNVSQGPVITRLVSGRSTVSVRCVSPDSTTNDVETKLNPKQTTTIILNTKGKCSVRPVSPPADSDTRKRKIMTRPDGKSALTRVVQRHLNSPRNSPSRSVRNKEIESLVSEVQNSFRSDAEERELLNTNKFRSEDDKFDLISDQRLEHKRKILNKNSGEGCIRKSLSDRLGRSFDLGTSSRLGASPAGSRPRSTPYSAGGLRGGSGIAARVLAENRQSASSQLNRRRSEGSIRKSAINRTRPGRKSDGIFNSASSNDSSVFTRLGNL